ncbi:MAG TPA: Yip1 family protein [Anaerolineales bacterium]|nr:Yip1 family protein [Anaerolineales bacterium]
MNEQNNTPMSPEPSGFSSWFSTWMEAITKPNEQTFARLAASPNVKLSTAFLWVFLGSLVNIFVASLMQGAVMGQMLQQLGLENTPQGAVGGGIISVICGAPIGAVISVVFFALFTGVVQWVAKMFGGTGTFEQLAYVFAAITVPFTLISSVLTLFAAIPYVGACFGFVGLAAGIYVIVLELMAVKGVNQFGWGQAAGSLFLPVIVLLCCLAAIIAGALSVLAPAIQDTFNQINQGLIP